MAKNKVNNYYNQQKIFEHIKFLLNKNPKGMTENELNRRHDPTLVAKIIEIMLDRQIISVYINSDAVGPNRRVYKLVENR